MARSSYTGLEEDQLPKMPDLKSPDLGFSGGLGVKSFSLSPSPIARAVGARSSMQPSPPTGIASALQGSPLTDTAPAAAPPQPYQPPAMPATPATPAPATPQIQQPGPAPGYTGGFDNSKLNYQGTTYSGPPVYPSGQNQPRYSQLSTTQQEQLRVLVEDVLGGKGYNLSGAGEDWRAAIEKDPGMMWDRIRGVLSPQEAQKYLDPILMDSGAASKYFDRAAYNTGIEQLRSAGTATASGDDEALLAELASRGILNSGVAAREISRVRSDRARNYQQAAARLNEIMYSNASAQAKQEALTRLNAELQFNNEAALAKLRANLDQQQQENAHQNDLVGLLGNLGRPLAGQGPLEDQRSYGG